jgi:hypothetical protein
MSHPSPRRPHKEKSLHDPLLLGSLLEPHRCRVVQALQSASCSACWWTDPPPLQHHHPFQNVPPRRRAQHPEKRMQFVAATTAIGPKRSSSHSVKASHLGNPKLGERLLQWGVDIAPRWHHYPIIVVPIISQGFIGTRHTNQGLFLCLPSRSRKQGWIWQDNNGGGRTVGMERGEKILATACFDKASKRPRERLSLSRATRLGLHGGDKRYRSLCDSASRLPVVNSTIAGRRHCRSRTNVTATGVSGAMGRYLHLLYADSIRNKPRPASLPGLDPTFHGRGLSVPVNQL